MAHRDPADKPRERRRRQRAFLGTKRLKSRAERWRRSREWLERDGDRLRGILSDTREPSMWSRRPEKEWRKGKERLPARVRRAVTEGRERRDPPAPPAEPCRVKLPTGETCGGLPRVHDHGGDGLIACCTRCGYCPSDFLAETRSDALADWNEEQRPADPADDATVWRGYLVPDRGPEYADPRVSWVLRRYRR